MRYILGVFGVIVLLIFIVILITRGSGTSDTDQTASQQVNLADYESKPATAELTTYGEVTANEERQAVRVTVSAQERVFELLDGYNENVIRRQTYANNQNAYSNFISALNTAGFSNERETNITDYRGVCPLGQRYVYELIDGSEQVFSTWSASCGRKLGSFAGNSTLVQDLFELQIPDYDQQTEDVTL